MDAKILTAEQIEEGKLLLSKLDKGGFNIAAAFWLFEKARGPSWILYLASSSPALNVKENLLKARQVLAEIALLLPALTGFSLDEVQLIPLDHPFITNISQSIGTGPGIVSMRMSGNQFDKLFIEDIYIYRLNAS